MTLLTYGGFEPDSSAVGMRDQSGRALMEEARGVWPSKTGYVSIPALAAYDSTHMLPDTCLGAYVGHDSSGGHHLFFGTTTKLYKYTTATGYVDYSRLAGGNYAVPAGEFWQAAQYGSQVIFVNAGDDPQVIDIDTAATNFTALGGSPPKSRYVGVVGDFLILAGDPTNPRRIMNSAINDATGWTIGVALCDQQDFPDGEAVTGFCGGEYGWVGQEHCFRRMIFQSGYDQAFRFERVDVQRGCSSPYSMICIKDAVYFRSDDGFYQLTSQGLNAIGHQRINTWFNEHSDISRTASINSFADPFGPRIGWPYYSSSTSAGLDAVLWYDWQLNQWSYDLQAAQFWTRAFTPSVTLEGLDVYGVIDNVPFPFDDRVWAGGQSVILVVDSLGRVAFLQGSLASNALLRTSSMQITPGTRSAVQSVRPVGIFNGVTQTLRIGAREHTGNAASFSPSLLPSSRTGIVHTRSSGREFNFEHTLTQAAGTRWQHVEGLDIEAIGDSIQ